MFIARAPCLLVRGFGDRLQFGDEDCCDCSPRRSRLDFGVFAPGSEYYAISQVELSGYFAAFNYGRFGMPKNEHGGRFRRQGSSNAENANKPGIRSKTENQGSARTAETNAPEFL